MLTEGEVRRRARVLRDLVELVAANVYFAPEAHAAYAALGLGYQPGYFGSRGACLGRAPGHVVAAAFGVFDPAVVVPAVDEAWATAGPEALLAAREQGAVASLERLFAGQPGITPATVARAAALLRTAADAATGEGRALFSGLRSLGFPGTPVGDLWRAADLVREHRGDSHIVAWVAHDLDAVQATVTTELWWRLPLRSYVRTRGWPEERIDAAIDDLRARGLMDGDGFSAAGEALRADVELTTDRMERRLLEALGHDGFDELVALLTPMAEAVLAGNGYPADPRRMTRP